VFQEVGCAKLGSGRVKKCISSHAELETLITYVKGCERLDDAFDVVVAGKQAVLHRGSVPDRVHEAFVKSGLGSQYSYMARDRVRLMRHSAGICPIHGVEHQSDNGYLT
jgi:hypothetical protein